MNIVLQIIEEAAITSAPSPDAVPAPLYGFDPNGDVSATELFIDCNFGGASPTVVPADTALIVYATPKLSKGISFVRSQLRLLTYLPAATDTSTQNLWTTYTNKYGAPAAGDNIVFAVQAVSNVSGVGGTPMQKPAEVVA